jgi:hypothetical protein
MTSNERDGPGEAPMRQRNAGGRGTADTGAYPGYDPEWNASGGERQSFLATTAKDQWIATFEPHDPPPLPGQIDQALVDPQLRHPFSAGPLAHRFQPRLGSQGKDFLRNERVVKNEFGLAQPV